MIILSIFLTLLLLVAVQKAPDAFPDDEDQIEKEGVEVDLVAMTVQENKGTSVLRSTRPINALIFRISSRLSILKTTQGIGGDDSKKKGDPPRHPSATQTATQIVGAGLEIGASIERLGGRSSRQYCLHVPIGEKRSWFLDEVQGQSGLHSSNILLPCTIHISKE